MYNRWDRLNFNFGHAAVTFVNAQNPTALVHSKTESSLVFEALVLDISLKDYLSNSLTWNVEEKYGWILQNS